MRTYGSRAEVWHGTAKKTSGGLTKSMLLQNKHGRIVSRKKHNTAKKEKRLAKAGYTTKKGQFGCIKNGKSMKRGRKGKKTRGGNGVNSIISPTHYNGRGEGLNGNSIGVQLAAGMGN